MIAIAIVLIVAAVPVACSTNCCPLSAVAMRMMASMACCTGTVKIHANTVSHESPDATLVNSTQLTHRLDALPVASLSGETQRAAFPTVATNEVPDDIAGDTPPIFLRDAQFRI